MNVKRKPRKTSKLWLRLVGWGYKKAGSDSETARKRKTDR